MAGNRQGNPPENSVSSRRNIAFRLKVLYLKKYPSGRLWSFSHVHGVIGAAD